MQYLNLVTVDDEFVEKLWDKVKASGSFYSIADGVTKTNFSRVLYQSALVAYAEAIVVRFDNWFAYVELHPILLSHRAFSEATFIMAQVKNICDRFFPSKAVRCIIPHSMTSAIRLAQKAGFWRVGEEVRKFSGMNVPCEVYESGGTYGEPKRT